MIVALLYFGQTYYALEGILPFVSQLFSFFMFWLVLFQFTFYLLFRLLKEYAQLNQYMEWVSLILVIFPIGQLIVFAIQHPSVQEAISDPVVSMSQNFNHPMENQPDIYYLIVDGYGRDDILSEFFAFDNSEFLNALKQRGFYVADESNTNYTQTMLSFSSSMTGTYLDSAGIDPKSEDRKAIQRYLDENSYIPRLHQMGYETVTMTNSSPIKINFADSTLMRPVSFNRFELGFQSLTVGRLWSQVTYEYEHWKTLRSELDTLEKLPFNSERPQFVVAHVLAPHPPFVLDANGNFRAQDTFTANDGDRYIGTQEEYISGYSLKVQYLNTRLIKIIDHLLSNPNRPVVIILQGDHGPGLYWDFDSLENSCLRMRLPIFNAYYLPDRNAREKLYPSISPVNSFRFIFNEILNQPMPLLGDRSFYSTWTQPYHFRDVSNEKDTCSPAESR